MRILVCPDKFKGSLSGQAAGEAIARGVRRAIPRANLVVQALADGGEGSLEVLSRLPGLRPRRLSVTGPLRIPVVASYLLGNNKAYIESAEACGLHLIPPLQRHPANATTIGVGMLIEDAIARGARDISLFLGGSATNDCGAGMAAALGYRFITHAGQDFIPMADTLGTIRAINRSEVLPTLGYVCFTAVCDVDNPLLGPQGATYTYAPQKGAALGELPRLEAGMTKFAELLRRDLGADVTKLPGAGAAGGLAGGAVAFLGARLRSGSELLLEAVEFDRLSKAADLIITGEGRVDEQTLHGKVVAGVVSRGKPTLVVCGTALITAEQLGVQRILSLTDDAHLTPEVAMRAAAVHLEELVYSYLSTQSGRSAD